MMFLRKIQGKMRKNTMRNEVEHQQLTAAAL